mmetsp:Transcript_24880/g.61523  ORF Transcript_24880/g.61523 Transcript_24880/m.61523 type:complete len:268 (-) Transcript_24880:48-851(-)
MASVGRLPSVLLILSVGLSPLPSSAAFVRPVRLTHTAPIPLTHPGPSHRAPQPTPTSPGEMPVTVLSAGGGFNLNKHLSQRDIGFASIGAFLLILWWQILGSLADLAPPIVEQYMSAIDMSWMSGPEIVSKLASVEVEIDAVDAPDQLAVIAVLASSVMYSWNKIPEAETIPRDRDLPPDVQLLENSRRKAAAGEQQKPLRLRDVSVRDADCMCLGSAVGGFLVWGVQLLLLVLATTVDASVKVVSALVIANLTFWFVFWWKRVADD